MFAFCSAQTGLKNEARNKEGGDVIAKRVKIKGVRRKELDYDAISYVIFVMAKRQVEERRARQAADRKKRGEVRNGR